MVDENIINLSVLPKNGKYELPFPQGIYWALNEQSKTAKVVAQVLY